MYSQGEDGKRDRIMEFRASGQCYACHGRMHPFTTGEQCVCEGQLEKATHLPPGGMSYKLLLPFEARVSLFPGWLNSLPALVS